MSIAGISSIKTPAETPHIFHNDVVTYDETKSPILNLVDAFLSVEGLDKSAQEQQGRPKTNESSNMNNGPFMLRLVDEFLAEKNRSMTSSSQYHIHDNSENNETSMHELVNRFLAVAKVDMTSAHDVEPISHEDGTNDTTTPSSCEQPNSPGSLQAEASIATV